MITNEEAKCIAESMAEQMLDAIEKKLKGIGEDFSEVEELAGLGKPIVINCDAAEAARNFDPYPNKSEYTDEIIKKCETNE